MEKHWTILNLLLGKSCKDELKTEIKILKLKHLNAAKVCFQPTSGNLKQFCIVTSCTAVLRGLCHWFLWLFVYATTANNLTTMTKTLVYLYHFFLSVMSLLLYKLFVKLMLHVLKWKCNFVCVCRGQTQFTHTQLMGKEDPLRGGLYSKCQLSFCYRNTHTAIVAHFWSHNVAPSVRVRVWCRAAAALHHHHPPQQRHWHFWFFDLSAEQLASQ